MINTKVRWALCLGVLLAIGSAAMAQGTFPGEHPRRVPLSADVDDFVICGWDAEHSHPFGQLWLLTGELDWIQVEEEDEAAWGGGSLEPGPTTQPAEPAEDVEDVIDSSERYESMIALLRGGLAGALDGRVSDGNWRRMASMLETHLYDWEQLAVLEMYDWYGQDGGYVLLARTPRGCFAISDVAPWDLGLAGWWPRDESWQAQPRITTGDDDRAAAFFQAVADADEPDILLAGRANYEGYSVRPRAVLHVISSQSGGRPWRVAIFDDDAWLTTRAFAAADPPLDPEAMALLGNPDHDPEQARSPVWRDTIFAPADRADYERVRDHVTSRLREFWMTALAPQRPNEDELGRALNRLGSEGFYLSEPVGVGGSAVGEGNTETDYWRLSQAMLRTLSREDFLAMMGHQKVSVRAMGMVNLALTARRGAADALIARLGRRATFGCSPFGCCGTTITEGRLALQLLHNARYLDPIHDYAPLLSRPEQFGLDLAVLARDDCGPSHGLAGNAISWGLHEQELALTFPALRDLAPELGDVQLVKAVGRIRPEPAVREFLLAILAEASLSGDVRLAAGSALTRYLDPAAQEALAGAEADLNELADGAGTELVRIAQSRAEMAEKGQAYQQWSDSAAGRSELEKVQPGRELVELYAACPVAALEELDANGSRFDWLGAPGEVPLASPALARWREAVVNLSGRLGEFDQRWSTYSDLAWRLDFLLRAGWAPPEREQEFFGEVGPWPDDDELEDEYWGRLGRANWEAINENVQAHIAARQAAGQ